MDASSLILNPKRQKLDGGEEVEGSSKSLSNLPDVVIQKIISLLETKDAIRTSILSKRWEYLWTSIPNLNFYKGLFATRSSLVNIVERALLLRGPADIETFDLTFPVLDDACRVNAWIDATVRRNVKKLYLYLHSLKEPFYLPHSLFTSTTLVAAELDIPFLFKAPSTVCFSSLRTLSLRSIVFSDDSTQQLFSGCPVLEELSIEECKWMNLKFVSICAPQLLRLTITELDPQLSKGSDGCQIMIFGVSLTYFYYRGELLNEYCFYDSSSPNEAEIHLSYNFTKKLRPTAYRLYKLLRGLSSVKELVFSDSNAFEVILGNAPELVAQMPLFNDLTTLVLEDSVYIDNKALLTMLQYCSCLETLVFVEGIGLSSDRVEDDGVLEPLPPCFLSHLKMVEVGDFSGDENELNALEILLKNAMVLENMLLACTTEFQGGPEKKTEIAKQLSNLAKGPESCEVVLV
ncbi:unnamed protein product [Prunus armeniaca]